MEADFSIELGREDPVLDFPWIDPEGKAAYFDLKHHPELIAGIEEVRRFPELAEFLRNVNSSPSALESAKSDVWETRELSGEEDVFRASHKCASYVDLVFSDVAVRSSFPSHENFVRKLTELLRRAPEIRSAIEICMRRCFYGAAGDAREGFYFTAYVNGFGNDCAEARRNWEVALQLASNAILQLSVSV